MPHSELRLVDKCIVVWARVEDRYKTIRKKPIAYKDLKIMKSITTVCIVIIYAPIIFIWWIVRSRYLYNYRVIPNLVSYIELGIGVIDTKRLLNTSICEFFKTTDKTHLTLTTKLQRLYIYLC